MIGTTPGVIKVPTGAVLIRVKCSIFENTTKGVVGDLVTSQKLKGYIIWGKPKFYFFSTPFPPPFRIENVLF